DTARTSDPVTRQRQRLEIELARATASITAMIEAFSEQLLTIDELRDRMPHLRAREASLRGQIDALDAQAADRDAYLKLADDLEGFLTQLNGTAATASQSADPAPAAVSTNRTPIRRVTIARVIYCVGGVMTPPCGVPSSVGENPFPASNTPAFSQAAITGLPGKPPGIDSRWSWLMPSNAPARSASRIRTRPPLPRRVLN